MDYKEHNGRQISRLGFGCMRLPKIAGSDYAIDEEKASALLLKAYERGVNYFDTAYPYHNFTSEKFVGKVLKALPRENINIVTKMPMGRIKKGLEEAKEIFQEQLENLETSYFDYYLLHAINLAGFHKAVDTGIYAWLQEKKKEGVIRSFGFSFHGYATDLETILTEGTFDFVQLQLNYLDWELQNAKLSYETVTAHSIPVMVMEPVRGGALTTLPKDAEEEMKAYHPEASLASWAFRWVGSLDNVLVVLSGMNSMEMLEDNLNTFSGLEKVSEEELEIIGRTRKQVLASRTIPCTKCQYCMPCTVGLNIPGTFALYNKFLLEGNKKEFQDAYATLEHRGSECIACQKCMKACPQEINIAEHMKQLDRTVMSL